MQTQSRSDYLKICGDYLDILNKVNLLLVKQHNYISQQQIYQNELKSINKFIEQLKEGKQNGISLTAEKQHKYLQQIILSNKAEIIGLKHKLQTKDILMKELQNLKKNCHEKYLKLISSEYQSSLQQKLSVIRGKVDDLKKKIKQVNKQINSYQQQHKLLMDDYSCQNSYLKDIESRNKQLKQQIDLLKEQKIKKQNNQ